MDLLFEIQRQIVISPLLLALSLQITCVEKKWKRNNGVGRGGWRRGKEGI